MNKILANWHQKGLKKPEDVEKDKQEFRDSKKKKTTSGTTTSYDMSEFNRRADSLPVYNKKKKGV